MIKQYQRREDSEESSESSGDGRAEGERKNRGRAIRISEEHNVIHTFQRELHSPSQEESNGSESQEDSDLEVSQSLDASSEDMDLLEKRIKRLQGSLERNLKNLPNKFTNGVTEGSENSNLINLTQKSPQKSTHKPLPAKNQPNPIPSKQQSKRIKKSIKEKCKRALVLRQQREELMHLRTQISRGTKPVKPPKCPPRESKPVKQSRQLRVSEIEKQLQLLKLIDSLEMKLRVSINKKVAELHQEIEETSHRRGREKSKESTRRVK